MGGRENGRVSIHCFGVACDALTLAATIPSVLVIDDEVFDELFGDIAPQNAEGVTVSGLTGQHAATESPFLNRTSHNSSKPSPSPRLERHAWP
ncbi:hypothetical protein GXW82_35660 [Streptacidiphilus sp. 4-A2]|nr:hypothetical protein [Streptacidiphilus sp. 4-A2]